MFYEFLKCGLYNTYNTCIIRFVLQSAQPTASSYNTRSCIVVHMAVYYTYVLYRRSIHTVLYSGSVQTNPRKQIVTFDPEGSILFLRLQSHHTAHSLPFQKNQKRNW